MRNYLVWLSLGGVLLVPGRSLQGAISGQSPSALLNILVSPDIPDDQWKKAAEEFLGLSPDRATRVLFPEIAKGLPGGYTYAAYNCFDPLRDRKVPGWGRYCVAHWFWCKELACSEWRKAVSAVLLELWAQPLSFAGQMALLNGLCLDPQAENAIVSLFVDSAADVQLRTEAAVGLLNQREAKYHRMVLEFANQSAPDVQDRLFRVLAHKLSVDPAVVGLGFSLLLQDLDKEKAARQNGRFASEVDSHPNMVHSISPMI